MTDSPRDFELSCTSHAPVNEIHVIGRPQSSEGSKGMSALHCDGDLCETHQPLLCDSDLSLENCTTQTTA